jgi:hypothetical protein
LYPTSPYPVRYCRCPLPLPLSADHHPPRRGLFPLPGLSSAADGCRRLQASRSRLSASLLLDAAPLLLACCHLCHGRLRAPSVDLLRPIFSLWPASQRRPPGPLSLIFTTGPAIHTLPPPLFHFQCSTSTSRSPLLFFLPAHSVFLPTDPLINTSATRRSVVVVQSRAVPFSQATLFSEIFVW